MSQPPQCLPFEHHWQRDLSFSFRHLAQYLAWTGKVMDSSGTQAPSRWAGASSLEESAKPLEQASCSALKLGRPVGACPTVCLVCRWLGNWRCVWGLTAKLGLEHGSPGPHPVFPTTPHTLPLQHRRLPRPLGAKEHFLSAPGNT